MALSRNTPIVVYFLKYHVKSLFWAIHYSFTNRTRGNSLWHMGVYAPATSKNHFKMSKIPNKNLARTSRYSMCARQVSQKTDIFCGLCKRKNNASLKAFFNTEFCLFNTRLKSCQLFAEWLCEHVEFWDTRAKHFVRILWHFKIRLKYILKLGAYASGAKIPLSTGTVTRGFVYLPR